MNQGVSNERIESKLKICRTRQFFRQHTAELRDSLPKEDTDCEGGLMEVLDNPQKRSAEGVVRYMEDITGSKVSREDDWVLRGYV